MENNQSVQQELSKVKESVPISESSKSTKKVNSFKNVAVYLFMHHPWLFVAGLLLMFLGGGALSIYSLGYVDREVKSNDTERAQAEVVTPLEAPTEIVESNQSPIPLWMAAAIVLSCASGCLVILRIINRPKHEQKQKQKVKKRIVNPNQVSLAQRRSQRMEAPLPKKIQTPVYVPQARKTPIMAMPPQKTKPKPVVTVLPPEQTFKPNQKNQDSLADILDIRKQTSLSSMLRK